MKTRRVRTLLTSFFSNIAEFILTFVLIRVFDYYRLCAVVMGDKEVTKTEFTISIQYRADNSREYRKISIRGLLVDPNSPN